MAVKPKLELTPEIREQAEIDVKKLAFSNKGVVSAVETILPEQALVFLESYNDSNRPLSNDVIHDYAKQMGEGNWMVNGESIIISDTGELLDGQHRLWACVMTNIPLVTLVTRGITKEAYKTIDTGRKRSVANSLAIKAKVEGKDLPYTGTLAAATKLCIEYWRGSIKKKGGDGARASTPEALEWLDQNPRLVDWVIKAKHYGGLFNAFASPLVAVCYLGSAKYEIQAESFLSGFLTGALLETGSPILALRNRLTSKSVGRGSKKESEEVKKLDRWERFTLIAIAWNHHVNNEKRETIKLPVNGEVPDVKGAERDIETD